MKFNIVTYYEAGDKVMNKRTKQVGTVVKSGHNPTVQFENPKYGGMENRRISGKFLRFVHPLLTFVNRKIRGLI